MKLFTKYALTLSAITLIAGTSLGSAFADYKPNRRDSNLNREQHEELGFTGILPLVDGQFTIGQSIDTPPNEIMMNVRIPLIVEGCYTSIPYELEKKVENSVLTVEMKYPIIQLDARKDCKKKRSMEQAKIAINLDELRENNVNTFRLASRYGTRNFGLELTNEYLKLIPQESPLLSSLEYWFLPENTVLLKVPMANEDIYFKDAILQELAMLAEQNGLMPIEEKIESFLPPNISPQNQFYFLDTKGDIREALNKGDTAVNIGSIHTTEPFYGPNGKYDKKVPMDVLATLPYELD